MSKIFHIPKFSLFCCDPKIDRNFHFVQSLNTKIKQKTSEIIQVNVPKMWILEPKSVFSILHIMYVGIDAILILQPSKMKIMTQNFNGMINDQLLIQASNRLAIGLTEIRLKNALINLIFHAEVVGQKILSNKNIPTCYKVILNQHF